MTSGYRENGDEDQTSTPQPAVHAANILDLPKEIESLFTQLTYATNSFARLREADFSHVDKMIWLRRECAKQATTLRWLPEPVVLLPLAVVLVLSLNSAVCRSKVSSGNMGAYSLF
jgi:hypothetical protein